jgi:hypothetical protein
LPFVIVAVIVICPEAVVVRVLPEITAPVVPALATVHTMVLFVALTGRTASLKGRLYPPISLAVGTPEIPVTPTWVTVISKTCELPSAVLVAVTEAVPGVVALNILSPVIAAPVTPIFVTSHVKVAIFPTSGRSVFVPTELGEVICITVFAIAAIGTIVSTIAAAATAAIIFLSFINYSSFSLFY